MTSTVAVAAARTTNAGHCDRPIRTTAAQALSAFVNDSRAILTVSPGPPDIAAIALDTRPGRKLAGSLGSVDAVAMLRARSSGSYERRAGAWGARGHPTHHRSLLVQLADLVGDAACCALEGPGRGHRARALGRTDPRLAEVTPDRGH